MVWSGHVESTGEYRKTVERRAVASEKDSTASSANETNKGNGQKREYLVLFWPKTDVPENNSGRECCWPYLIGQHPLSPGNSY